MSSTFSSIDVSVITLDPADPRIWPFIDKVHSIDEENLKNGVIKPTHMTAALMKAPPAKTKPTSI